jgi:uncharacterized protein YndB with AHSA1/START domain
MATSRLGTLSRIGDGRWALTFERHLTHPPARVWHVITDPGHLAAWFPAVVTFDLTPGATLRYGTTEEQRRRFGLPAEADPPTGEMLRADPPTLLEYTWGADVLRWEIQAEADGSRLVFTHICADRDTAAAHGPGWHAGLEVVEAQVDDRAITWSAWDRADELTTEYAHAVGPG